MVICSFNHFNYFTIIILEHLRGIPDTTLSNTSTTSAVDQAKSVIVINSDQQQQNESIFGEQISSAPINACGVFTSEELFRLSRGM